MVPYKVVGGAERRRHGRDRRQARTRRPRSRAMILQQAEGGRRGTTSARRSTERGDHRARLLQRHPAPGDQGRRQDRRPRRQAHHQRADRRRARLRPRQEERRDDRRLRPRRRHLRHLDPRGRRRRLRGASRPTATRTSAATTSTSASSTGSPSEFKKDQGIDLAQGPDGAAAPEGGRREGQDRAVARRPQTEINLPFITADATGPEAPAA